MLKRLNLKDPLFLVVVGLPTLLAILYFGLFANDVYISESNFVVRSPNKSQASPIGVMLTGGNLAGVSEENNAVMEYLESRRALDEADRDGLIRKAFTGADTFWLDRFGAFGGTSREQLYQYFLKKVTAEQTTATNVTRLTVRAYSPQDAQRINARLLDLSEALVNSLSERARSDSVAVASREVAAARELSRQAGVALARYRNQQGVIDPEMQATALLQMISKLQDELVSSRAQLQQLEAYTPQASQIPFLRSRVRTIQKEINDQMAGIAGGKRSLSLAGARYQELQLDGEFAEKKLAAALRSLEEAQSEARRKRAYVERIANPNLPDYAVEPRRIRGILATFILGLLAWGVLSMLVIGIKEHRD